MAHKRTSAGGRKQQLQAPGHKALETEENAVPHGSEDREVGYGKPPVEHQWRPGESGNPNGCPKHRTNLWVWFTKFMGMTGDQRAAIDRTKLTAAQETALKMVERAIKGKGCGFERLARYIVDREEGKAAEHLIISEEDALTDEECEELRKVILERHTGNDCHTDQ